MIGKQLFKQGSLYIYTPSYELDGQILLDKRTDLLLADGQIFLLNIPNCYVLSYNFDLNRPPFILLCFLTGNTASSLS